MLFVIYSLVFSAAGALTAGALLASCGDLFSFQPTTPAATMTLDQHELYLMEGDRCTLTYTFDPDTVSNTAVFWISDNPDVVTFDGNELVALRPGETTVTAISVEMRIHDACSVVVGKLWEVDAGRYAYDMPIYADITVDSLPLQPWQRVAAFCDDEVRGVAEVHEQQGQTYWVMRIYSHYNAQGPYSDLNPQDPLYPYDDEQQPERFVLRMYDQRTLQLRELADTLTFDGEAHGTLSSLVKLQF